MKANTPLEWMKIAFYFASKAMINGDVPIGAIIIKDNKLISSGFNAKESSFDPTDHAEIVAIRRACKKFGRWRLSDCDLFTTLEPCIMCAGAIQQARIRKVYYSTKDPKCGACGSLYSIHQDIRTNHRFDVEFDILPEYGQKMLKDFFNARRKTHVK